MRMAQIPRIENYLNLYIFFINSRPVFTAFLSSWGYATDSQIYSLWENDDGHDGYSIYRCNRRPLVGDLCIGNWLRETWRSSMNTFYVVGAVVSVCLLVYLVIALLKAEEF
jgi:K+-transporting ATPase KdpF subunit